MASVPLSKRVFVGAVWLFLVTLVGQVFTIGLYLFADFNLALHFLGAIALFLESILLLVVSFVARPPGRSTALAGALILLTVVQGILPSFKYSGLGLVAALHPVNALLLFWLGLVLLRDARAHVRAAATA